jgi:serine/threonine protein kinase
MAQLAPGTIVGGYRIESVAGRGGMGVVYRATQLRLNRIVALKVIADELAEDPGFRSRFDHESEIAASIDHPNVIPVYEAGDHDGMLYLSMRFVEGTDLKALIRGQGRLSAERAARIIEQVAEALDAAHARGLVHRDIKPANILIAAGDRTYLTDFGLTKHAESASGLTKTGTWVGTADYVAPEQVQGQHVDARTDVYSLGCVLFESLTGQIPFPRPTEIAKIYAHLQEPPPGVDWAALGVPATMDGVVRRAMAKDPADRYPSAGDLGRAAQAAAGQRSVAEPERTVAVGAAAAPQPTVTGATQPLPPPLPAAPPRYAPPPPPPPQEQPRRRSRTPFVVAGVLLLLAGAGVGIAAAAGAFKSSTNTVVKKITTGGGQGQATVPADTVRQVLDAYEHAYANKDLNALDALFAPDFKRRAPPRPDMGRSAALTEYKRQFANLQNPGYSLSNESIETGPQGATATADYTITDGSKPPASGTIAFSMVVRDGKLLIDAINIRSG